MQQLSLEVRLADFAVMETFFPGRNAAAVHALAQTARVQTRAVIWLWGAAGTGKTHLLQATVHAGDQAGSRCAYLPLRPDAGLLPDTLQGMGDLDLICIDDVHAVAGIPEWERGLFTLYERLRARGSRLVIAADRAPLHVEFALADLVSRFSSGATFRLKSLSDDEKVSAMQLRAAWRGLKLPDETARFIMARVDRQSRSLFDLLDRLDRAALAAQRKLTVPFVRSILDERAPAPRVSED